MPGSNKVKHTVARRPSSPAPGHLFKRHESIRAHETCAGMFPAALFGIAKMWRQLRCPAIGRMNRQNMAHLYHGLLSSKERQAHNKMGGSQIYHTERKKPDAMYVTYTKDKCNPS